MAVRGIGLHVRFARDLAASQLCSNIEQLSDKSVDDLAVRDDAAA